MAASEQGTGDDEGPTLLHFSASQRFIHPPKEIATWYPGVLDRVERASKRCQKARDSRGCFLREINRYAAAGVPKQAHRREQETAYFNVHPHLRELVDFYCLGPGLRGGPVKDLVTRAMCYDGILGKIQQTGQALDLKFHQAFQKRYGKKALEIDGSLSSIGGAWSQEWAELTPATRVNVNQFEAFEHNLKLSLGLILGEACGWEGEAIRSLDMERCFDYNLETIIGQVQFAQKKMKEVAKRRITFSMLMAECTFHSPAIAPCWSERTKFEWAEVIAYDVNPMVLSSRTDHDGNRMPLVYRPKYSLLYAEEAARSYAVQCHPRVTPGRRGSCEPKGVKTHKERLEDELRVATPDVDFSAEAMSLDGSSVAETASEEETEKLPEESIERNEELEGVKNGKRDPLAKGDLAKRGGGGTAGSGLGSGESGFYYDTLECDADARAAWEADAASSDFGTKMSGQAREYGCYVKENFDADASLVFVADHALRYSNLKANLVPVRSVFGEFHWLRETLNTLKTQEVAGKTKVTAMATTLGRTQAELDRLARRGAGELTNRYKILSSGYDRFNAQVCEWKVTKSKVTPGSMKHFPQTICSE